MPTTPLASGTGSPELMMMLLADARLPTGAHTQSAGLEPALLAGMRVDHVPDYIAARIRTVTATEVGTALVARHRALQAPGTSLREKLAEVQEAWAARTVSSALRETSMLAGRGYVRLIARLWPDNDVVAAVEALGRPCRAVVLGAVAALSGLSGEQLVRLIGSDDAQTITAAVLKLEPLDPVITTGWLLAAHGQIDALAMRLGTITEIEQIPANAAPLIEQWAQRHESSTQRLFRG